MVSLSAQEQILKAGRDILLREGLRGITTHGIARRAHISKKTLYKVFPTKDALLEEIVVSFVMSNLSRWDKILERESCAMDRILASLEFVSEFLPRIQMHLIDPTETVQPKLWERIDAIRLERLHKLKGLMKEAQREGFLRTEVDPDHWILLLIGTVRSVLTPDVLLRTGTPLLDLVGSIKSIYYTGLLTKKGRDYVATKETSP